MGVVLFSAMTKTNPSRDVQSVSSILKSTRGETIPYRQLFEAVGKSIPFMEAFIVSTLPRGGVQIVQPAKLPELLFKSYTREFNTEDRLTWQAIARQQPLRGKEAWKSGGFEASRYYREFLQPNGVQYVAAVPLAAPVFPGYPGVIQFCRTAEQGEFTDAELEQLVDLGKQLNAAIEQQRASRRPAVCQTTPPWAHQPAVRQFVFDADMRPLLPGVDLSVLDDRLRQQLTQHARYGLEHISEAFTSDRLQAPDQRGDLWTFRVVTYKQYPALSSGPVIFFCLQPEACDWATIRPSDFAADVEISRLVPALRFMQDEFHRSPTLVEIAKQVHLSPFHFHRRFTELLGLTPKHFLLECQISEAKRQLVSRQKDLVDLATDCGFAHQSHFTSRFKQATGLTPTRWRRFATDLQRSAG